MAVYDIDGNRIAADAFINVRDYGAVADSSTDDSAAIQAALDAVSTTGGIIYFPSGVYALKANVHFYSKQTLWFEDGATLLQAAALDNLLISYSESTWGGYDGIHDCLIYGGTFDGGEYTENNTLVGIIHAKNIIFERCTFLNAYGTWHDLEINASYNVKVLNCDFEGARKTGNGGEMLQIDAALNSTVWPWAGAKYDSTVSKYIEIAGCIFHDDTISPAIGNHSAASHQFIRIHDNIFDGNTGTKGAISFNGGGANIDIYENTFNGCTIGVGTYGSTYYIHNNRFVGVTTAASGSSSVVHANMVNGSYVA